MSQILNNLGPLFIIIILGAVLARRGWFTDGFTKPLNRVIYWIALPSVVVVSLAGANFDAVAALKLYGVFMAGTAGTIVLALFIAVLYHMPTPSTGAFVQAAFRGNLAIIGLPVLSYYMAQRGAANEDTKTLLATGALVLGASMITYNILSVIVLMPSQRLLHKRLAEEAQDDLEVESGLDPALPPPMPSAWHQIATNPLIIASLLGAVIAALRIPVPEMAMNTLKALANLAVPGALLCIGASLGTTHLEGRTLWPSVSALIKVAATPVFTLVVAAHMDLSDAEMMCALLFSACPTAAASYIMADRMGADSHLAGSAIALSTLYSAIPLSIVLALFGG